MAYFLFQSLIKKFSQLIRSILVIWGVLLISPAESANAPAGSIELVRGKVVILDKSSKIVADTEGKRDRKVAVGAPFYIGETVQTLADGRVKLTFKEGGNQVVLGTNTSLTIERASITAQQAAGTTLNLARGEVRSSVNRKYSGTGNDVFEVKTANAVAGVRGTVFLSKFNPTTQRSDFATERGAVFVKGASGQGVMVNPGMFTSTTAAAAPKAPAPIATNPDLKKSIESLGGGGNSNSSSKEGSASQSGGNPKNDGAKNDNGASGSPASQKNSDPATSQSGNSNNNTQQGSASNSGASANGSNSSQTNTAAGGPPSTTGADRAPASFSGPQNNMAPPPVSVPDTAAVGSMPRAPDVSQLVNSALQQAQQAQANKIQQAIESAKDASVKIKISN